MISRRVEILAELAINEAKNIGPWRADVKKIVPDSLRLDKVRLLNIQLLEEAWLNRKYLPLLDEDRLRWSVRNLFDQMTSPDLRNDAYESVKVVRAYTP